MLLFAVNTIECLAIKFTIYAKHLPYDLDTLAIWERKWNRDFHRDQCNIVSVTLYTLHCQPSIKKKPNNLINQTRFNGNCLVNSLYTKNPKMLDLLC